ncbi:unnamed protein product [Lactuca virosa]|uniref:Uncharacterized protein n=1 Tax=Lactuca virosa TaxID=75947 RepID=A0AAU9MBW9_9ASTR|nr:unnamed protein product [Lactuca virosa]
MLSTEKQRKKKSNEMEMSGSEDVRVEIPQGNQPEPVDKINIHDVAREWEGCFEDNDNTQHSERKRQMQKVHPLLLKGEKGERNRHCYEPAVVSLGPYHHNRDDFSAANEYKLVTLEEYRLSCGTQNNSMDSLYLYNKVFEVIHDARKCYIHGSTDEYNDEQFNRMMLLDGCFILFFIECVASQNTMLMLNNEYLGALGFAHISRDILLLENQIPFIVLQVLLDLRFPEDRGERILNWFFNYLNYGEIIGKEENVLEKKQPLHLLELYRSYFISLSSCFAHVQSSNSSMWHWRENLDIDTNEKWNYVKRNRSFASVTELKAKGIFLKCTKVDDESSNGDIKFHSHYCYGELELVSRAVYSNSKAIYLNMIAYEMCPHNPNDFRVSTYIRVMKSLVIRPDDVKELRDNNILLHSLGRDEDVVKVYDEIDAPAVNVHMFNQLRRGIEKHCNNKYKTWAAELINIYFSSPWKTMALLVATAILITSFLQTYFTIWPDD